MSGRPSTEEIAAFYEWFKANFPPPPSAVTLGWTVVGVDVEKGVATIDFTATEEMFNPGGSIQGGYLAAMMDDTMGPLMTVMAAGRRLPSTTDLHLQYHRRAAPGTIRCVAKIIRMGRLVATCSAEMFDGEGQLLVTGIQTAVMMQFDPSKAVAGKPRS